MNIHPKQKFLLRKSLERQEIPEHTFRVGAHFVRRIFNCSGSLVYAGGIFPSSALRSNLASRISLALFVL